MAAPIVAAAAITAATELAKHWMARKNQGAQRDELRRIESLFDNIKPPEYDIKVSDDPAVIGALPLPPTYDMSKIKAPEYKVLEQYTPEIAPFVAEERPDLVKDTEIGLEGRQAQLDALQRLRSIGAGEFDPQFQQRVAEAQEAAATGAQTLADTIAQRAQRRGALGSGAQLAAELSAAQQQQAGAADISADAASQAYLNQLNALRGAGQMGRQLRGDELDVAGRNVDIINAFNQRTSKRFQDQLRGAADVRNEAQRFDIGRRQAARDATEDAAYRERVRGQEREDVLKGKKFDAQRTLASDIEDRQRQPFEDQIRMTQAKAGIGRERRGDIARAGALDQDLISNLGSTGVGIASAMSEAEQREKDRRLKAKMAGVPYDE